MIKDWIKNEIYHILIKRCYMSRGLSCGNRIPFKFSVMGKQGCKVCICSLLFILLCSFFIIIIIFFYILRKLILKHRLLAKQGKFWIRVILREFHTETGNADPRQYDAQHFKVYPQNNNACKVVKINSM